MIVRRSLAIVAAVVLTASLAVSCSDDGGDDSASTCQSMQNLSTQVDTLLALNPVSVGADGVRTQVDAVKQSWQDARDAAGDQFGDELDAFQSSIDALSESIGSGGGVSGIQSAVDAVKTSWQSLTTAVDNELSDCTLS